MESEGSLQYSQQHVTVLAMVQINVQATLPHQTLHGIYASHRTQGLNSNQILGQ
jgi:hypothetical protein